MICYPVVFRKNGRWETYAMPIDKEFAKMLRYLLITRGRMDPRNVKIKRGCEF